MTSSSPTGSRTAVRRAGLPWTGSSAKLLPRPVALVMLVLFAALFGCRQQSAIPVTAQRSERPLQADERDELVIAAVGDIMMPASIQSAVARNGLTYDILFERISPDLGSADITFANLETTVDHQRQVSGYPKFNARPELLAAIKRAGIDVLSVANNHVMDAGAAGLRRTLANIEAAGLVFIGAGRTKEEAAEIRMLSARGVTVAFLAFTYDANQQLPGNRASDPGVALLRKNSRQELAQAAARVKQAREQADIVAVSLHWGDEYAVLPSAWQREAAAVLAEAGADLLIGHHPHVLQPIETVPGRDGRRALVAYSLGNFISSQNARANAVDHADPRALRGDGIILRVIIGTSAGRPGVRRAEFLPVWSLRDSPGGAVLFRPVAIVRELARLGSLPRRSSEQQQQLDSLRARQQMIVSTLATVDR